MKPNFQLNAILINEIEGEKSIKKKKEKTMNQLGSFATRVMRQEQSSKKQVQC